MGFGLSLFPTPGDETASCLAQDYHDAALPIGESLWPDGRTEEWADVPIDRYTTLVQGTGK